MAKPTNPTKAPKKRARSANPEPPAAIRAIPKMHKIGHVAEALGLSYTAVSRLIQTKQLPSLKIGGSRMIADHDLWVYLKTQRKKAAAHADKLIAKTAERKAQKAAQATLPAPPPGETKQPELPHTDRQDPYGSGGPGSDGDLNWTPPASAHA